MPMRHPHRNQIGAVDGRPDPAPCRAALRGARGLSGRSYKTSWSWAFRNLDRERLARTNLSIPGPRLSEP
jgi:hypothetical protein